MVKVIIPPTLTVAVGPNKNPAGFIRKRLAFPNPVVWMVPKMFEMFPPVTRPRMLEVARPESFRKLAMLLTGHIEIAKAMKEVGPIAWARASRDVIHGLASGQDCRGTNVGVEARWRNWHIGLGQGEGARDGKKESEAEYERSNEPIVFPMGRLHGESPLKLVGLSDHMKKPVGALARTANRSSVLLLCETTANPAPAS